MSRPQFKKIITYGTFDLFHVGHVRLLRRLANISEQVIVGCSTDCFNKIKGKQTVIPYDERVETLEACRYVSEVFPEKNWDQKPSDIRRFEADLFAMGDDWKGKFDHLNAYCDVLYLPRTEGISTTLLKARAKSFISFDV